MGKDMDFHIGVWKIGSINSTSGLFAGENLQYGWRLSQKYNVASRGATGDYNIISNTVTRVDDPDLLDTWVQKTAPYLSVKPPSPAWVKVLRERSRAYKKSSRRPHPLDFDW